MTVTNSEISATLHCYLRQHPGEEADLSGLIGAVDAGSPLISRTCMPGHVTCGAAVIDDRGRVLMIHHRVLDRWLLPGGHLEAGDIGLLAGALRELTEETGIPWRQTVSRPAMDIVPVDIDVHHIPANPAKDEGAHWHADFRYAFWVKDPQVHLQLDEVTDYAWRQPADLQTARLIEKVGLLAA